MKKKSIAAILLAFVMSICSFFVAGCGLFGGGPDSETVAVTGVTVSPDTVSLTEGGTQTLTATVSPSNATNKSVTWKSSSDTVATVSGSGVVTAKAVGTATITVTTADGGKTATCSVTVSAAPQTGDVRVTGVTVTPTSATLTAGETTTLTATVSPSNAANKNVNWSSSDTTVATVSGSGVVTAKAAGTATITVSTADGGKTATCAVKVNAAPQTVKQYTVKFYSDGTVVDTQTINENGTASAPEGLSKQGYVLSGWAKDSVSGTAFDLSTPVTTNLNLHAKWSPVTADSGLTYQYAGNENAAFEWGDNNAAGAKVEYKLSSAGSYTAVDKQLIRQTSTNVARVDIVGLKGGATYDFKITSSANKEYVAQKQVYAYDRSGYAHFGKSDGVGGYNDDGTPKSNATIIYVNEQNKNSSFTVEGKSYTGIVGVLTNSSKFKNALIVRIVGTVGAATWNKIDYNADGTWSQSNKLPKSEVKGINGKAIPGAMSQAELIAGGYNTLDESVYTELVGLSSNLLSSSSEFDSCWNDCSISGAKNVTVEGIGEDARIFQWGMTFKNSNSIEVRNLTFEDYTEDACSFEGGSSNTSSTSADGFTYKNFWVHHNTFEEGVNYWDVCSEQDKHDGDGSTDIKRVAYVTFAYNIYHNTHKTGLVGSGDDVYTAAVTFHHNYYNGCKARLPLARKANMHMYNNYYFGTTSCSISLRGDAYAFVENCYFNNNGKGVDIELQHNATEGDGSVKVYNSVFDKKNITLKDGVASNHYLETTSRTATVTTTNKFGGGSGANFDLSTTHFYYDGTNKKSDVSVMFTAADTKKYVPSLAGVQKRGGDVTLGGAGTGSGGGSGTETPEPTPEVSEPVATANGYIAIKNVPAGTYNDGDKINTKTTIKAASVTVDASNVTAKDNSALTFTTRVKLGGATARIEFTTTAAAKVHVYACSSSSTEERTLALYNSSDSIVNSSENMTAPTSSANMNKHTFNVSGAGTYYLKSTAGGINVYYVEIEYTSGGGTETPEPNPGGTLTDSANVTGEKSENSVLLDMKNGGNTVAKVTLIPSGTSKSGGTLVESDGTSASAEGHIQLNATGALTIELAEGYTYKVTIYAGSSSTEATRDITINDVKQSTGIGASCTALTWNLTAGTFTSTETGKIRIAKIVIVATPV